MDKAPLISVVVPVRNEAASVEELARQIAAVLHDSHSFEILFIDDGSDDDTWQHLLACREIAPTRLFRFRRNFGKTAALACGFRASRGQIVFTMDGDLQDDPKEIPHFLSELDTGFDLVSGYKRRRHDPPGKVIPSRIFNWMVRRLTGISLHDVNCGFKAYRREVTDALTLYGDMHRFLPVLAHAQGFRISEIEVEHHARRFGRSKYGFSRLFKGFFDLITVVLVTQYGERPAHAAGWLAGIIFMLGTILPLVVFLGSIAFSPFGWQESIVLLFGAWPALVLSAMFALGILAIGWVAEFGLARTIHHHSFPVYSVEEQID